MTIIGSPTQIEILIKAAEILCISFKCKKGNVTESFDPSKLPFFT